MAEKCACGSELSYNSCCGPYLSGKAKAPTAEALLRARYTAYVKHEIDYVEQTHDPKRLSEFDRGGAESWSKQAQWQSLEIVSTKEGKATDTTGSVEFIARFAMEGKDYAHHEQALFRREGGDWYFVDGKNVGPNKPYMRETPKIGRNDACPCGSGKKFKKCCEGKLR